MSGNITKQNAITVANWQDSANLPWSFLHMAELFPTEAIRSGEPRPSVELNHKPSTLHALAVDLPDGRNTTVADILASTNTDAWMVLKDDMVLAEQYFGSMQPSTPHLLMSVSKSIVSTVIGVLVDEGTIDPGQNIEHYIPELSGSGYQGASIRDILDMRSGIKFSEDYLDPGSEVRQLDEAVGWAPRRQGNALTLKQFLMSLEKAREHGGPFEYRSCETDVLGWLCEAVSGQRFAELASRRLWSPLGTHQDASIAVDAEGTGMFDGGISASLRDLALFGAMIRDGGLALDGRRIVDARWVDDIFTGGPDSQEAFASGKEAPAMPGGKYRSQFWFLSEDRNVAYCLGIHGQMVYINRQSGVVGVKFSSTPLPVDPIAGPAASSMFQAISESLGEPNTSGS